MSNRLLRAYGTSLLGVISGLLTNLWLLREITYRVSTSEFGIYAFTLQILTYLSIIQLGLDFAVSRQIAEYLGKEDEVGANHAYYELRRFNSYAVGIFIIAIVVVVMTLMNGYGITDPSMRILAAKVAVLAGFAQTILFLARPYDASLIGSQHQAVVNLVSVARTISTTIIAVCFLYWEASIIAVVTAEIITQIAYLFVVRWQCRRLCKWRNGSVINKNNDLLKSIVRFGGLATIGGFAWTVEATSDVFILGMFLGPSVVAQYVLWWRFPQMIFSLNTNLASSAFPGFALRHGTSQEHARGLLDKVGYISLGLATLAYVGISLWLPFFIKLWLGDTYSLPNGPLIAVTIGLLICLRTLGNLAAMFWLAKGNAQLTTVLAWLQAAVKVIIGVVLVHEYQMFGLLLASCIAALIQVIGVGLILVKEQLINRKFIRDIFVLLVVAFFISQVSFLLPRLVALPTFIIGIFVTTFLWSLLWFGFAWNSGLRPNLKFVMSLIYRSRMKSILEST